MAIRSSPNYLLDLGPGDDRLELLELALISQDGEARFLKVAEQIIHCPAE